MKETVFYVCPICGNIVEKIMDSGNEIICCGRPMMTLEAGITDGAVEKHVPCCKVTGDTVEITVGSEAHPMTADHYIQWIEVITTQGTYRRYLVPGVEPKICLKLQDGEKICRVYAYCNKHKLWKTVCDKDFGLL